mmetsp:Transcript_29177/g.70033  ORF Transcript_29177/g.70033 Transcript_29177/m.70033 type:complete len:203 (+) Transcript_29177:1100-1708(+)
MNKRRDESTAKFMGQGSPSTCGSTRTLRSTNGAALWVVRQVPSDHLNVVVRRDVVCAQRWRLQRCSQSINSAEKRRYRKVLPCDRFRTVHVCFTWLRCQHNPGDCRGHISPKVDIADICSHPGPNQVRNQLWQQASDGSRHKVMISWRLEKALQRRFAGADKFRDRCSVSSLHCTIQLRLQTIDNVQKVAILRAESATKALQ